MSADWTEPRVKDALPAVRCPSCGTLANSHKPDAPCVFGCDDAAVVYEPTFVRGLVDHELPDIDPCVQDCYTTGECQSTCGQGNR